MCVPCEGDPTKNVFIKSNLYIIIFYCLFLEVALLILAISWRGFFFLI